MAEIECLKVTVDSIRDATRRMADLDGTPEGRRMHFILVNLANAMANEMEKVVAFLNQPGGPGDVDNVWIGQGNDLPARGALGGVWGPNVHGHINDWLLAGAPPNPFEEMESAPSGAHTAVLQDARIDPLGHWIVNQHGGASWVWAAKPFVCDETWIHYESASASNSVQHTALYTGTASTVLSGSAGQILASFKLDPCNHVRPTGCVWTAYAGDESWIHVSGFQIQHTAYTGTGWTTGSGSAGQVLASLRLDANNHVDPTGFTWTAAGSGTTYTADGIWISLSGTQFRHIGPSSEAAYAGSGSGQIISRIGWDSNYHIASGSVYTVTLSGDSWIAVSESCSLSHNAPNSADGSPINSSGGAGTHCATLKFDSRGHFLAATWS
jgi:hypothetical protein